jgi:GTP-binding protein
MSSMPVIAIVGRPNVGKSSLLNALAGKRISIVQDMPGVTRDRVSTPLQVGDRYVELVDTGGYGFDDSQGLSEHIKHQIELAMSRANLVLFIVDCQVGLTSADENIASLLRRKNIKTVLVANKADSEKADVALGDFSRMGFGTPIGVSALNARGIDQIFAAIEKNVDLKKAPKEIPDPQMLVAIVGKRNAGKSTLVNSIAMLYEDDPQRVIVSEVPGTTRDSVDVRFEKDGKTLVVIDTAGVRKKRHMVTNDIEFYSFHRAERSIRRADVVLFLLDGTEAISEPDKKLAAYISEQFKPVIIVVNKWDLAMGYAREQHMANKKNQPIRDEELMEKFVEYARAELKHLDYAPVAFVTAKDGKNVQAVLDLSQHLFKQSNERVTTGKLNRAVKQIFEERIPPHKSGKRVKVFYATQIEVAPPTIALIVNNPSLVDANYQRFMINRFRELLPYAEVPIKVLIRERKKGDPETPPPESRLKSGGRNRSAR